MSLDNLAKQADKLIDHIDHQATTFSLQSPSHHNSQPQHWSEAVRNIDFSHSSRKAWSTINNLTGRSQHSPRNCPVSANAIAAQLVRNRKYEGVNRESSRLISQEVSDRWRALIPSPVNLSGDFSSREFAAALQHVKPGKAPGPDSICPELIIHAGTALKSWLRGFLSSCLCQLKIFQSLGKSICSCDPKAKETCRGPKELSSYLLALCPLQDPRTTDLTRIEPIVDPLLPGEQAGFRHGKSTVDQVVLLTQNIEDSFEAKKKAGAVFVDLTAAYDTVWHHGLTCKLLRLLPDNHMIRIIMELIRNRSFTLTTGDSKRSRLRRLKNGVPQGSVLAVPEMWKRLFFKRFRFHTYHFRFRFHQQKTKKRPLTIFLTFMGL